MTNQENLKSSFYTHNNQIKYMMKVKLLFTVAAKILKT